MSVIVHVVQEIPWCVCVLIVVLFCAFEYVCFNIWVYFSVWGGGGGGALIAFVSFSFLCACFVQKLFCQVI